jgi:hypothetical protein
VLKNPQGVLVIQRGEQVIVYLPKTVSADVKKNAVNTGVAFLTALKLPSYYSVTVAKEGVRDEVLDLVFA